MPSFVEIKDELYEALSRNEFILCYEPQLDLKTKKITGVEALIRWHHPERGILRPADFIDIAEQTGLIIPLGEWVMQEAFLTNKKWQDHGYSSITVAINISPKQFHFPRITETIKKSLETTALDPHYIVLEIAEMTVMKDIARIQQFLQHLKGLGITWAIDDFGTGNTSISYLQDFPIGILKIDQSFVATTPQDENKSAIISNIIEQAHRFGAKVIAEGVKAPEQIEFLTQQGCDTIQGSAVSEPLMAHEVEKLLSSS